MESSRALDADSFPTWPQIDAEMVAAAEAVLRSGKVNYWTGSEGVAFEREFAAWVGVPYALTVANGTVALEAGLRALGIGPGDEVILPSRTFIASASAIVAVGARPVFVDVDPWTGTILVEAIGNAVTQATRAILAVHLGGWPCDMPAILDVARRHGLRVVEDCAQAQGATLDGRMVGSFGDVAAFSFCQDKLMTTAGEGGMVCTHDELLWKRIWAYRDHGKDFDLVPAGEKTAGFRWVHESFGSNLRMTEVQSAVGRVALKRLAGWLERRRANAAYMADRLGRIAALRIPAVPEGVGHAYYRFYAFVRIGMLAEGWDRDRILEELTASGIPCGSGSCSEVYLEKAFPPEWKPSERLPVAWELGECSLAFLVHPTLELRHVERICDAVEEVLGWAVKPGYADLVQRAQNLVDLLNREPVAAGLEWDHSGLRGRVAMVTGAAGSIGSEICAQILRLEPAKLVCVDRDEAALVELRKRLEGHAVFVAADVADGAAMRRELLAHGVNAIFHAAAEKHVPLCEAEPGAAIENNVFGLMELLEAADDCDCSDFVLISSDKAVKPGGVMGCTKRLGEMILAARPFARMRCVAVRFGNVLGSQGSVVPIFEEQIRRGVPVTVTHAEMTRYFMTVDEAAYLVLEGFGVGEHGDVLVLEMGEPVRIVELARRLGGRGAQIEYIGVRPGEKLHEALFYEAEIPEATAVRGIRRVRSALGDWTRLSGQLEELRERVLAGDGGAIREKLREMIPEYGIEAAREEPDGIGMPVR